MLTKLVRKAAEEDQVLTIENYIKALHNIIIWMNNDSDKNDVQS